MLIVLAGLVIGCTSVPHVDRERQIEEGKYDVVIDRDYINNPKELEYAINSFVMEKNGYSYDVEKYGSNDFYVTMPGSQEVKDLPKVKHFHLGRTLGIAIPAFLVVDFAAALLIMAAIPK